MDRRSFIKVAGTMSVAAMSMGASGLGKKAETFPEKLDLVNLEAKMAFRMLLKGEYPIEASKKIASGYTDAVIDHYVICDHKTEAVGLFGLSALAPQGVRIRVNIDGEDVLTGERVREGRREIGIFSGKRRFLRSRDILAADASTAGFLDHSRDIFSAQTPQCVRVGVFLTNGTHIQVVATVPQSVSLGLVRAQLRAATYKTTEAHETADR